MVLLVMYTTQNFVMHILKITCLFCVINNRIFRKSCNTVFFFFLQIAAKLLAEYMLKTFWYDIQYSVLILSKTIFLPSDLQRPTLF